MPAAIAAWRAGFCPCAGASAPGPGSPPTPRPASTLARFSASSIATWPSSCAGRGRRRRGTRRRGARGGDDDDIGHGMIPSETARFELGRSCRRPQNPAEIEAFGNLTTRDEMAQARARLPPGPGVERVPYLALAAAADHHADMPGRGFTVSHRGRRRARPRALFGGTIRSPGDHRQGGQPSGSGLTFWPADLPFAAGRGVLAVP